MPAEQSPVIHPLQLRSVDRSTLVVATGRCAEGSKGREGSPAPAAAHFFCNHAITPLNKMSERAMSLSQIAGDAAEASQVIKGESQDIKAELDPSYVSVKVKQQVRYFLATF